MRNRFEIYATQFVPGEAPQEKLAWSGSSKLQAVAAMERLPEAWGTTWRGLRVVDYGNRLEGAPEGTGTVESPVGVRGDGWEIAVKLHGTMRAVITRPTKGAKWFYHEMGHFGKSPSFKTKKEALAHAAQRIKESLDG